MSQITQMGTFSVQCHVANHSDRQRSILIERIMVDTGSEFSWIPADQLRAIGIDQEKKDVSFQMANGETITRSVGFAILHVGNEFTIDEVVFAEPGDLILLGARTLEGLNLMVDPARKRLVAAGPLPVASLT